jgi:hypothetical protein
MMADPGGLRWARRTAIRLRQICAYLCAIAWRSPVRGRYIGSPKKRFDNFIDTWRRAWRSRGRLEHADVVLRQPFPDMQRLDSRLVAVHKNAMRYDTHHIALGDQS